MYVCLCVRVQKGDGGLTLETDKEEGHVRALRRVREGEKIFVIGYIIACRFVSHHASVQEPLDSYRLQGLVIK